MKENGANTTIIQSEITHYATFESGIFKFDQSETVYLHCHVRVCFQECDIDCSGTVDKKLQMSKFGKIRIFICVTRSKIKVGGHEERQTQTIQIQPLAWVQ